METPSAPPAIFSHKRRIALRNRMRALQAVVNAPRYLMEDMIEDMQERLSFLRHDPEKALVIGDWTGELATHLRAMGAAVTVADPAPAGEEIAIDEEQPYPSGGYDLIISLGTLDTVNDLPGALIHIRNALARDGLMIASFMGAGCLPSLRAAMLTADGDRPAPRLHPAVDVRAGGQLMTRCGYKSPVVDSRGLDVRFGSMDRLVKDLRAQGLGNALSNPGPTLSREAYARAKQAFRDAGDAEHRTTEHFEILTLSGWRP